MHPLHRKYTPLLLALSLALHAVSCAKDSERLDSITNCATRSLNKIAGPTGSAYVFLPDPISASGLLDLSPTSLHLDDYRGKVELSNLEGTGVLVGKYVDVRNGMSCNEGFGAYEEQNDFSYPHRDARFQEAMVYYFGDRYREMLDQANVLEPPAPVKIVAHCMNDDNAFFFRGIINGQLIEKVCLGDSVKTPGASYADDATVTVHELQHATTVHTYSERTDFNQFLYDEAGAMNEAISDFMALMFTAPYLSAGMDPKLFSRWALDRFIPNYKGTRGAHRCPTYDPSYPNCSSFPSFSGATNTVSYVYPDGTGWPYANNFSAPGYARSAFLSYPSQEEIHNAGVIIEGSLWDIYEALRNTHGGSTAQAQTLSAQLVMKAIRLLPTPSLTNLSPATFRSFGSALNDAASLLQMSNEDQQAVRAVLTARGLYGGPTLPSGWADVGPGTPAAPGLEILDNPTILKDWFSKLSDQDPDQVIKQSAVTGMNHKLDAGEVAVIWFDIKNTSEFTAGGIQLTVTSNDPDVTFVTDPDPRNRTSAVNLGLISPQICQIQYSKINGTSIVQTLNANVANPTYQVPTSNNYFDTNPFFDASTRTGLWVKISPSATARKTVTFTVELRPSNGESSVVTFPAQIN